MPISIIIIGVGGADFSYEHSDHSSKNYFSSQAIIEASAMPISIIIIGVGGADFSYMEKFDADKEPLRSRGMVAQRDIVQFVPFNEKFSRSLPPRVARARLAKEVLAEIPWQVVSYMHSRGITPNSPMVDFSGLPPDPEAL